MYMLISILSTSLVLQIFFILSFLYSLFSFCITLSGTLGCMQRLGAENFIHLDREIEKTLKRILKGKREATEMEHQPMEHMEGIREEEVGSRRGGSVHPDVATMDTIFETFQGLCSSTVCYSTYDQEDSDTS